MKTENDGAGAQKPNYRCICPSPYSGCQPIDDPPKCERCGGLVKVAERGEVGSVPERRSGKTPLHGRPIDDNGTIEFEVGSVGQGEKNVKVRCSSCKLEFVSAEINDSVCPVCKSPGRAPMEVVVKCICHGGLTSMKCCCPVHSKSRGCKAEAQPEAGAVTQLEKVREFRRNWSHKPTPIPPDATGLWYSEECVDKMLLDYKSASVAPSVEELDLKAILNRYERARPIVSHYDMSMALQDIPTLVKEVEALRAALERTQSQ